MLNLMSVDEENFTRFGSASGEKLPAKSMIYGKKGGRVTTHHGSKKKKVTTRDNSTKPPQKMESIHSKEHKNEPHTPLLPEKVSKDSILKRHSAAETILKQFKQTDMITPQEALNHLNYEELLNNFPPEYHEPLNERIYGRSSLSPRSKILKTPA